MYDLCIINVSMYVCLLVYMCMYVCMYVSFKNVYFLILPKRF